MCKLEATASGVRMVPSGNLSFTKRTSTGWMCGSWIKEVWDPFAWLPLRLREGNTATPLECLHDCGRQAVPISNYTLEFALQLRKSKENLSQDNQVIRHYSLRRLRQLFREGLDWPASVSPWSPQLPSKLSVFPQQRIFVSTLFIQCSDVSEEWNLQIQENLPVGNVPRSASCNA